MAQPAYTVPFQDVALSAATAKTVAYVLADRVATIKAIDVTFDGVTAANTPVLIEIVTGTAASNSTPGTGSTTVTPVQIRGRVATARTTAAKNCTSEPTVLTQAKAWRITPTGGVLYQLPLGGEIESDATTNKMVALRLTAAQTVNVTGSIEFEE